MKTSFDLLVIGAGHAGIEAAYAAAQMGLSTGLMNFSMDTIGVMSCNPAIGGLAKGHLTREIDALGGLMGEAIDACGIKFRMLNRTKGPAVWGPRAQADKDVYSRYMTQRMCSHPLITVIPEPAAALILKDRKVAGAESESGRIFSCGAVVITTGTFLNGVTHRGTDKKPEGRFGERPSVRLAEFLKTLDLNIGRLKTGTPCRLNRNTLDYSRMEIQNGDEKPLPFSYMTDFLKCDQVPCYTTYTSGETRDIILTNLHLSALYGGHITGIGPRYCPSLEDKFVKFKDKEKHMLFVEPEGRENLSVYINGASSSMPCNIQELMIRSIAGLEKSEILRFGYAIEYDFIQPTELFPTLELKKYENLFLAGQINGTSGYEEAAAQGFVAGINAALKLSGKPPFIPKRSEGYMGVMVDDLVTKGVDEPYRLFTSRAEYRILLRQDTADFRMTEKGYLMGIVKKDRYDRMISRKQRVENAVQALDQKKISGKSLSGLYVTQEADEDKIRSMAPEIFSSLKPYDDISVFADIKYRGYMDKELERIRKMAGIDERFIPEDTDYARISALRVEARQKFAKIKPQTLGQARNIPGISPADIQVLSVALEKRRRASSSDFTGKLEIDPA